MKTLTCEITNYIALVRVNRPKVLNALNREVLEELLVFLQVTALQQQLRAVILSGTGEKAFIAGADIKEMQTLDNPKMLGFCRLGQEVADALENAPFLTIAAVNGYALGGGCELAMACDFIYASDTASFGLPEVSLGLIPGFGGTQRLPRIVGVPMAKELIMSGRKISAEEAMRVGLVNRVCSRDSLISACKATALEVSQHPFPATWQAKRAINGSIHMGLKEAFEHERNMCALCFASPERAQAMAIFLDRAKAK